MHSTPIETTLEHAPPQLPNAQEWSAVREGAALLDRSDRGKLMLSGSEAVEFLNGQVTNELQGIAAGDGRYAAFLTHKGKMLGDLRILATTGAGEGAGSIELLLDCEREALQSLFDMIRRFKLGYDVQLHKRTLECGLLRLIGPHASAVLSAVIAQARTPAAGPGREDEQAAQGQPPPSDWEQIRGSEHQHLQAQIGDLTVRLIACADGDLEILCAATEIEWLRSALIAAGAVPIAESTAETLRIQRGIPRFGLDMDESTIPQEAGINERAVSFTKGCYVGQETVARLYYKGRPNRTLRGIKSDRPVEVGDAITAGERQLGRIGSSALSPEYGPIALALIRREAATGDRVRIGPAAVDGEIVALPFG